VTFRILLSSTILFSTSALAQVAAPTTESPTHNESDEIVVTGLRDLSVLAGTSVLSGEELQRDLRPQLGDTLTRQPGVSATSFTPGASRPVLRGFQGERVRVLTDGIGSIDVSNTSADHAVTIDPLTAERIEILRGPAVLLYGGQASGGAVNVIDRRIPRTVPENGYHVDLLGVLGSTADERSVGGSGDLSLGGGLVLHIDGAFRKTDDVRTGGYVLSPTLRQEQLEIAAEELDEGHAEEAEEAVEAATRRGRVPNTATEQKSIGGGIALIRNRFNIGASITHFDSDYGVPSRPGAGHHHHEEEEEGAEEGAETEEHGEASVTIGLKQTRADFRGQFDFDGGPFQSIRLRAGHAKYRHTEFEGDEVGTVFRNKGTEGRLELVQRERGGLRGVSGLQYSHRDFEAVGAEAFLAPNKTNQFGLFTLQEMNVGALDVEAALRYDRSSVRANTLDLRRRFNSFSGALGIAADVAPRTKVGLNLSHTQRAPSAEELFSNGPHIATQAFEIGDPNLNKEKSWGVEGYARLDSGPFKLSATLFYNKFDNFIYEAATGEEEDELPVFAYLQNNARHLGFELEASARLFQTGGFSLIADGVADYTRATIRGGLPVPRIPPLRLLGGLEAQSERLDGRVEVEWISDQERVAAFETTTNGFTLVNASVAWKPFGNRQETTLLLSANNIFDVEARRHASFTKDYVPLAGRDLRLSLRTSF
jgi:iron complex outermembrane receptor protein